MWDVLNMAGVLDFLSKFSFNADILYWSCIGFALLVMGLSFLFGDLLDFSVDGGGGPFSGH